MWVSVIWAMSMARSYIDSGPAPDYKRAHAVPGHAQDRQDPAGVPDRRRDGGTPSGTGGARPKTDLTDPITFSDPRGPRPPPGDRGPRAFVNPRGVGGPRHEKACCGSGSDRYRRAAVPRRAGGASVVRGGAAGRLGALGRQDVRGGAGRSPGGG